MPEVCEGRIRGCTRSPLRGAEKSELFCKEMGAIAQEQIVGQEIETIYCDADLGAVVLLRSGKAFVLPSVIEMEIQSLGALVERRASANSDFDGALITDLIRPIDLTDLESETQESVKLILNSGRCISLMWWGMGPYLRDVKTTELIQPHQSFWTPSTLPSTPL
jgi:hypothetical protein